MSPSEKFTDLGGQLPDESHREIARRRIPQLRRLLDEHHPPEPPEEPDAEEAQQ